MQVQVVDATAVAALLFADPLAEQVVEQLDEAVIVAPTILESDLCILCLEKVSAKEESAEHYLEALKLLQDLKLEYIQQDIADVVRFAAERNLTINQAYYLRLVSILDAGLVSLSQNLMHDRKIQPLTARQ